MVKKNNDMRNALVMLGTTFVLGMIIGFLIGLVV